MHATNDIKRACARFTFCALVAVGGALVHGQAAQAAGTAAGTPIQNQATATYQDASGNTYNTNSNTVTTTVQNAPSLTITPPGPRNVAPGGMASDVLR